MNRASSATGWVRNPAMTSPDLDPRLASSYELGWTSNPLSGCLNHTPEGLCLGGLFPCYAFKLANGRLMSRYLANPNISPVQTESPGYFTSKLVDSLDPFYPRLWKDRLGILPSDRNNHKGVFVCDMSDLFGIGIPEKWTNIVLGEIMCYWHHRFYLLTKQPQNLIKFSPFPDNCYVGVTVTNDSMMQPAYEALDCIMAKVKYISLEPYRGRLSEANIKLIAGGEFYRWLDWLIIGACTGRKNEIMELCQRYPQLTPAPYGKIWTAQPRIEWVEEIVRACDKAGIPVFLKDNLKPLLTSNFNGKDIIESHNLWAFKQFKLRQEMPG